MKIVFNFDLFGKLKEAPRMNSKHLTLAITGLIMLGLMAYHPPEWALAAFVVYIGVAVGVSLWDARKTRSEEQEEE